MVKCLECNREFSSDRGVFTHALKNHLLTAEKYLRKFNPKFDLYTGDPIEFKNAKQYKEQRFNSRDNYLNWLKLQSEEVCNEELLGWLKKRRDEKGLSRAIMQVELRSCFAPSIYGFDKLYIGGYKKACEDAGLKNNFDYNFSSTETNTPNDLCILVDTREQRELVIYGTDSEKEKLIVGDYTAKPPYYSNVFIERKSQSDLISTLSEYDRFVREIERARSLGLYICVIVESPFELVEGYKPMKHFKESATGKLALKRIRDILHLFDNIQFLFVKGRPEATGFTKKILTLKEVVKNLDLQYLYDTKKLLPCG